ncbi:MAG: class A beta-lactamase-related serine hydrolase [Gemmatimonadota bacterium]|nr:MAG: class A beta-lactamase-related serine hydrolase [Gemmatimonadota bacterium]
MTLPNRRSLIPALLFGLAGIESCTEPPDRLATLTQPERLAELEVAIPALMDSGEVTGLAMAVVNDSAIVWSRGFGVRSVDTGEPVDESSVFEAASLSKPVFAYAVLQLVDQRVIDLDTPIAEYYDHEDIAYDERHRLITPRMVLTHSTGLPNWRPRGGRLTIDFEPGSEFSYSGEGFGYLQRAIMHITDEPLQELMDRLVFEPLGMTSSSYIWDDRFEANLALPHNSDGELTRKGRPGPDRGHAAATLHTSASDFARFMIALMNGTGLRDSVAVAMLTPQIEVDSGVTWGLGIGLQENESGRGFWHWGDNAGYKAYTLTYPDRGVGMIWFTNSDNGHAILEGLLAETVGGEHRAVVWLDYEQYDAPTRRTREAVWRTIEEQGLEAGIAAYHELKASHPPDAFNEYVLNTLGYRLLRSDRVDQAIEIFKLNVEEYPDASNPYDSLGEAYMVAGEVELAIENYEKSLELNPENTNAVRMLERMRAQQGG